MWPKMLFELLPHVTRLIPMADKFFASRSADDKTQQAAMAALAEGVRGDLGKVTEAHAGLYRQVQQLGAELTVQLSAPIAEAVAEAKQARLAAQAMEARLARLEARSQAILRVLLGVLVLVATAVTILIVRKP